MKPDEQRIAISKACGLDRNSQDIPDYLNDLNATREMEKSLGEFGPEAGRYVSLIGGVHSSPGEAMWACRHAASAKCAESFLRAKNLWKD